MVWLKGCTLYVYSTKLNIFTFFCHFQPFSDKEEEEQRPRGKSVSLKIVGHLFNSLYDYKRFKIEETVPKCLTKTYDKGDQSRNPPFGFLATQKNHYFLIFHPKSEWMNPGKTTKRNSHQKNPKVQNGGYTWNHVYVYST